MRISIKLHERSDSNMGDKFSGRRIKAFRKSVGMTQAELADKADVNINTLAKWERNEQCPSVDNARTIAKILGKKIDDFFDDDKIDNEEKSEEKSGELNFKVGTEFMTFRNGEQEITVPYDRELSLQILKSMFGGKDNISIINGNNNSNNRINSDDARI